MVSGVQLEALQFPHSGHLRRTSSALPPLSRSPSTSYSPMGVSSADDASGESLGRPGYSNVLAYLMSRCGYDCGRVLRGLHRHVACGALGPGRDGCFCRGAGAVCTGCSCHGVRGHLWNGGCSKKVSWGTYQDNMCRYGRVPVAAIVCSGCGCGCACKLTVASRVCWFVSDRRDWDEWHCNVRWVRVDVFFRC